MDKRPADGTASMLAREISRCVSHLVSLPSSHVPAPPQRSAVYASCQPSYARSQKGGAMVCRFEQAFLQQLQVGEVPRGAIDYGARTQRHQSADYDLRLFPLVRVLCIGWIRVSWALALAGEALSLLITHRLEQFSEIQLSEAFDGDSEGKESKTCSDPSQKSAFRCEVVAGGGASVRVKRGLPEEAGNHGDSGPVRPNIAR